MTAEFSQTAKEDVISELMKATQLGRTTLFEIVNAGISDIESPKKTRNKPKKYSFDSFDIEIIKSVIKQFYAAKTLPYIKDIQTKISENENLTFKECSLSTFYKLMKDMGFKKENTPEISRKISVQKTENVIQRRNYLTEKKKLELKYSDYLWVYLDETYINKNLIINKNYFM
jgi:predicted DNA-binding transcriptional regulator AlpA